MNTVPKYYDGHWWYESIKDYQEMLDTPMKSFSFPHSIYECYECWQALLARREYRPLL